MTSSKSLLKRESQTLLCLEINTAPETEWVRLTNWQQWGFGFIYQMSQIHARVLRRLRSMTSSLTLLSHALSLLCLCKSSSLSLPVSTFNLCIWLIFTASSISLYPQPACRHYKLIKGQIPFFDDSSLSSSLLPPPFPTPPCTPEWLSRD